MLQGHGDDIHHYADIRINFSSNVVNCFSHEGLFRYLRQRMPDVLSYPEPSPHRLEQVIAHHMGIEAANVSATNGATEAIYLVAQAFRGSRSAVLVPTFSEYADACRMHGHMVQEITCLTNLPSGTDIVWLCNPNNPTGTVIPKAELEQVIAKHPEVLFVVDASYAVFTLQPLPLVGEACKMPNVIMLHSMTKEYAVPGLRIGFLTACEPLLNRIRTCRMPWSVNQVAIAAGHYLLAHPEEFQLDIPVLMQERERVRSLLNATGFVEAYPSDTHILLCRLKHDTAANLKERLAHEHGILIRDASNFAGLTPNHFRIAVQSPKENDVLIEALNEIVH